MERRKRTSMYDPYREDIVTALEAGKTIRQIYDEIIRPALNGYRSAVSRQRNDVYKFKTRGKKK